MAAYAKVATAAGLTREQAVRIYAFETGGNGTYDVQAGLTRPRRKGARPISPAMGYNQLLNTNTIGLLAAHGDAYVQALATTLSQSAGPRRPAMERKIEALRRMIAFCRTVPTRWGEHDKLAKPREAASASTPRCSTATSARCCRPRSSSIPWCSRAPRATARRSPRPSSR